MGCVATYSGNAHNPPFSVFLFLGACACQERVENRRTLLMAGLNRINERYLNDPLFTSLAYLPIAEDTANRIVRFHAERSFAFSTKSRVPYLTVVEVVEAPYMRQLQRRCVLVGPCP